MKKRNVFIRRLVSIAIIALALFLAVTLWPHKDRMETNKETDSASVTEQAYEMEPENKDNQVDEELPQTEEEILEISEGNIDDYKPGEIIDNSIIDNEASFFQIYTIEEGGDIYKRIYGKSYVDNDHIKLSELRYLKMLHYNYEHHIQVGEMIVNEDISEDVLAVFRELYENEYEIESMRLIDDFWMGDGGASDDESIRNNNTSAFCYRYISRGSKLSNHAYGRAIDINPKQNPYIWKNKDGSWEWSAEDADQYIDRNSGADHMVLKNDVCYLTFVKYGFSWGGNWNNPIDYQHFERK